MVLCVHSLKLDTITSDNSSSTEADFCCVCTLYSLKLDTLT